MSVETINGQPTYSGSKITFDKGWIGYEGFPIETRGDLNGSTSAALNYWMQQQQNAYDLELWNLNNQYNKPSAQMARYQEAGLNPNLIYGQSNSTSGPASSSNPIAAKPTNFVMENRLKGLNLANQLIGQVGQLVSGAQKIADYALYGAKEHGLRNELLGTQADALANDVNFKQYVQYPFLMSKYSGEPQTITLPDGSRYTWSYADSLEGQRSVAETNRALADEAVKRYIYDNILPWQVVEKRYQGQAANNSQDVYDKLVQKLNIEDKPTAKLILWNIVDGLSGFSPAEMLEKGQNKMMQILPFLL